MVGGTGIEPVTPSVSRKCSPTELTARADSATAHSWTAAYAPGAYRAAAFDDSTRACYSTVHDIRSTAAMKGGAMFYNQTNITRLAPCGVKLRCGPSELKPA